MSIVFSTVETLRDSLRGIKSSNRSIGLVPTMGALHEGHLSLINRAKRENSCVVVSIFVNPLQFGEGEDFSRYPRDFERDRQFCQKAGVDLIFAPSSAQIYPNQIIEETTKVFPPVAMTSVMCGRSRVGHFTGVATVVTKLLNIVQPHRAYFGQKDGQQLAIILQLVQDLNFSTEVVTCPTLRIESGLALSSRNQYLNSAQLIVASSLYKSLKLAEVVCQAGEKEGKILISVVKNHLSQQVDLEYVELVDAETLQSVAKVEKTSMLAIAGRVGITRLIDNILLK